MTEQPALMTVEEAATYLRVNRMTVYRLLRRHTITGVQIGPLWRIWRKDLEAYSSGTLPAPGQNEEGE
jgi:excisionase family DNA binding protein